MKAPGGQIETNSVTTPPQNHPQKTSQDGRWESAVPMPGWSRSRRGRWELLAVGLFCGASIVVPICRTELFPFSRAPMFADAPAQYCNYTIHDPDGNSLPAQDFHLPAGPDRNYWGNPLGVGVGYHPPHSVDRFGEVPSKKEVTRAVREHLAHLPALAYVEVTQEVIGAVDEGQVGPIQSQRWRVHNPAHQGAHRGRPGNGADTES